MIPKRQEQETSLLQLLLAQALDWALPRYLAQESLPYPELSEERSSGRLSGLYGR